MVIMIYCRHFAFHVHKGTDFAEIIGKTIKWPAANQKHDIQNLNHFPGKQGIVA